MPVTRDGVKLIPNTDGTFSLATSQGNSVSSSAVVPVSIAAAATPIIKSATGIAGAAVSVTLPAVANKTTYITGFTVTTTAPTTASNLTCTVSGLAGDGTLNYNIYEAASSGSTLSINFPEPVPASAANTAIVVAVPALATGGAVSIVALGHAV